MNNLTKTVSYMNNIAVTPMINHVHFKNLTPLMNILKAIMSNAHFPWYGVFSQDKRLKAEMKLVQKTVNMLSGERFLTYRLTRNSPQYAVLAYSCTQILIATSATSLERYRGVGSEDYSHQDAFDKKALKSLVLSYTTDPKRGFNYEELTGKEQTNLKHGRALGGA